MQAMSDVKLTREVLEEIVDKKLQPLYATISELQRSMEFINFKYKIQLRTDQQENGKNENRKQDVEERRTEPWRPGQQSAEWHS